jgi:5-methylcytosine-specific restriction endonuclease McrA
VSATKLQEMNYWRMAFRIGDRGPEMWPECYKRGIAALGYYLDGKPVVENCSELTEDEYNGIWQRKRPRNTTGRASLRKVAYQMKVGDIIFAKQGPRIVGRGRITSEYKYDPDILEGAEARWEHFVEVDWNPDFGPIDILLGAEQTTVLKLSGDRLHRLQTAIAVQQSEDDLTLDDIVPDGALPERIAQLSAAMSGVSAERVHSIVSRTIRRDTQLVRALKELCEFRCQFPGCGTRIPKRNGEFYIEVAHIWPVSKGGQSVIGNLLVLCPNHHKEFDYGDLEIVEQTAGVIRGKLNGKEFEIRLPGAK